MTRKHFVALAAALRAAKPTDFDRKHTPIAYKVAYIQWVFTVEKMVETLSQFNGEFKRDRFVAACGLED